MSLFDLIAFDADDTLWHNERLYQEARHTINNILGKYPIQGKFDDLLHGTEMGNLRYFGYGVMSFILSSIEAAVEITQGQISGEDIQNLIDLSKEMISAEVRLYDHVEETLAALYSKYPLMLITKGDLLHQQSKIDRSGIKTFFEHIEVVSDKTPVIYQAILDKLNIPTSRFLMVGNSMRSDILPVHKLGGWAVYVPNDLTWSHETGEPPTEPQNRYFELRHVGLLPDLVKQLDPKTI